MLLGMLLIGGNFILLGWKDFNYDYFNRGPIWISVNYLALSALKFYATEDGPYQKRCALFYDKLRKNVVKNILKEHKRTGFFWEQYDDQNGNGMRGHPFTGWTATVVNMVFEHY